MFLYFDFVNQESVVYMSLRALVVLLVSQSECRTLINNTTQCSRTAMTRSLCLPSLRESRLITSQAKVQNCYGVCSRVVLGAYTWHDATKNFRSFLCSAILVRKSDTIPRG